MCLKFIGRLLDKFCLGKFIFSGMFFFLYVDLEFVIVVEWCNFNVNCFIFGGNDKFVICLGVFSDV